MSEVLLSQIKNMNTSFYYDNILIFVSYYQEVR